MMEFSTRALVPDIGDIHFDLDRMDTFKDIDIKMEDLDASDPLSEFSMEHNLNFFEFDSMKNLTLDLDAVVKGGEKRSLLDDLDTTDKIRQDCMWSTGQNLSKLFKPECKQGRAKPYTTLLNEDMSLTPPTSYINEYLKHFETPLPSDEDSCCSSGDEIDVGSDWSSVIIDQENRLSCPTSLLSSSSSSKDHSYTTKQSGVLTPPESSEDEESYQGYYVSKQTALDLKNRSRALSSVENDRLNQAVNSILQSHSTDRFKPPPKAKFTFKVNIRTKSKSLGANRWHPTKSSLRRTVSTKSSISSLSKPSSDDMERPKDARDLHNHMERQRRTDLKNAFDFVKDSVPTISSSDRVSKQMILDKAIEFCRALRQRDVQIIKQRRALLEQNAALKLRLQSLENRASLQ